VLDGKVLDAGIVVACGVARVGVLHVVRSSPLCTSPVLLRAGLRAFTLGVPLSSVVWKQL
jgi:hypothetical protein